MAEFTFLNRDTRFYVQLGSNLWEVPILSDYGFTQATESSEVTLSEAEDSSGDSVRGRATFNDALNPAEWNVNAYIRPYKGIDFNLDGDNEDTNETAGHSMVDAILWAALMGADTYTVGNNVGNNIGFSRGAASYTSATNNSMVATTGADAFSANFSQSNKSQQPEGLTLYFVIGERTAAAKRIVRISQAAVNEASITFDLEGIATVSWSGFGRKMEDITGDAVVALTENVIGDKVAGDVVAYDAAGELYIATGSISGGAAATTSNTRKAISTAATDQSNLIANRLTQLIVKPRASFRTTHSGLQAEYKMALTGGTITLNNNLTFLTPEELGKVNEPLRNVTGARNISGDFTCYLRAADGNDGDDQNRSLTFWNDLAGLTTVTKNEFEVAFNIGGSQSTTGTPAGAPTGTTAVPLPKAPGAQFYFPQVNFEIPAFTIEDVISFSATFNALPSTITETDEVFMTAVGK